MRIAPQKQAYRSWSAEEYRTWKMLFENQIPKREAQIVSIFSEGVQALGLSSEKIPDINEVNKKLKKLTGFEGLPVVGLEEDHSFYYLLTERKFPIGNFIRDAKDLSYTPAPDVFHDLYGHLPFLANKKYADFCEDLGRRAVKVEGNEKALRQWARLFWFTIEFALVKTKAGNRIFGAGIASSYTECEYALSSKPEVIPFDIEIIRNQEFKIDDLQHRIFLLENPEQLYSCLETYEKAVLNSL